MGYIGDKVIQRLDLRPMPYDDIPAAEPSLVTGLPGTEPEQVPADT